MTKFLSRIPLVILTRARWDRIRAALAAYDQLVTDLTAANLALKEPVPDWAAEPQDPFTEQRLAASARYAAHRTQIGLPLVRMGAGFVAR